MNSDSEPECTPNLDRIDYKAIHLAANLIKKKPIGISCKAYLLALRSILEPSLIRKRCYQCRRDISSKVSACESEILALKTERIQFEAELALLKKEKELFTDRLLDCRRQIESSLKRKRDVQSTDESSSSQPEVKRRQYLDIRAKGFHDSNTTDDQPLFETLLPGENTRVAYHRTIMLQDLLQSQQKLDLNTLSDLLATLARNLTPSILELQALSTASTRSKRKQIDTQSRNRVANAYIYSLVNTFDTLLQGLRKFGKSPNRRLNTPVGTILFEIARCFQNMLACIKASEDRSQFNAEEQSEGNGYSLRSRTGQVRTPSTTTEDITLVARLYPLFLHRLDPNEDLHLDIFEGAIIPLMKTAASLVTSPGSDYSIGPSASPYSIPYPRKSSFKVPAGKTSRTCLLSILRIFAEAQHLIKRFDEQISMQGSNDAVGQGNTVAGLGVLVATLQKDYRGVFARQLHGLQDEADSSSDVLLAAIEEQNTTYQDWLKELDAPENGHWFEIEMRRIMEWLRIVNYKR
ncbi:hypothetical protein MMC25_002658 [Agyrium rufum]|nr:hypothetical protein [Agyrium rufum]